jgi:outer membrane protein assembly factor BamB
MRVVKRVMLTLLATGLVGCGTVGGWFGFGGEAPKVKPNELVDFKPTATLARAWEVSVGASRPYTFNPAGDGQAVFAAGKDGRIVRVDLASGREVWRVESGKTLSAGVGVGTGLAVVGTTKGDVLAYQGADGKLAWSVQVGGEVLSTPAVGAAGVAVRTLDGRVMLLAAKDGKRVWSSGKSLPSLVLRESGEILITDRAVFVGYPGGKLQALSLANGAPLWEATVTQVRGATEIERIADVTGTLVADQRIVCAVAFQGRLSCFDQVNGNPVWSREFSGLTGVAQDETTLYAADAADTVQAFDKQRGSGTWKQAGLANRKVSTPLPLGRFVAVADSMGYIHLLQSASGAFAARAATDGSPVAGRMLALDNGLIVQTVNGGVYAFKIQ